MQSSQVPPPGHGPQSRPGEEVALQHPAPNNNWQRRLFWKAKCRDSSWSSGPAVCLLRAGGRVTPGAPPTVPDGFPGWVLELAGLSFLSLPFLPFCDQTASRMREGEEGGSKSC